MKYIKLLLLPLLILLSINVNAQIGVTSVTELKSRGKPIPGLFSRYAVMIKNNRPTFYLWKDICNNPNDDSVHLRIDEGCWERATNNYLTASNGIVRNGDDFQSDSSLAKIIDLETLAQETNENDSFLNAILNTKANTTDLNLGLADINFKLNGYAPLATTMGLGNQISILDGKISVINTNIATLRDSANKKLSISNNVLSLSNGGGSVILPVNSGPKGDAGTAATINIGTVNTGVAGSSVVITNSGSSSAAILNFTIPPGLKGDQGSSATANVYNTGYGLKKSGTEPNVTFYVDTTSSNAVMTTTSANQSINSLSNNINGKVPQSRILTINGVSQDLSNDRTFNISTSTYSAGTGISVSNGIITNTAPYQTSIITTGYGLTKTGTDPNISLTTDTSKLATAVSVTNLSNSLNTYLSSKVNQSRSITINGTTQDLSADRTFIISGTNLTNSVTGTSVTLNSSTGTSTTFNVPQNIYTAGTNIAIVNNVISTTDLSALSLPNVTVGETAVIAINAGWRNITVPCTGIQIGDRVQVNPLSAPAGYAIGQGIATATNTIVVQVFAPLLAIGASYSIPCKITVLR